MTLQCCCCSHVPFPLSEEIVSVAFVEAAFFCCHHHCGGWWGAGRTTNDLAVAVVVAAAVAAATASLRTVSAANAPCGTEHVEIWMLRCKLLPWLPGCTDQGCQIVQEVATQMSVAPSNEHG